MRTLKPSSKNNLLRSYNSSDTLELNEPPIILKKESSFKPNNSHSPEKQLNPFVDHRYLQPFKDMVPLRQQEFEKLPEINTKSNRNILFSPHLKNMLHSQQNISMVQGSPKKKTIMQLLSQSSSSNELFLLDTQPSEQILKKEKSSEITLENVVIGQQHQSRFFKMNSMENNFNHEQGNVQEHEKEGEQEEEYHVWDNSFYKGIGLDIDSNFEASTFQNFVQLFYVRSQQYQEANVSKTDVLDEIKILSAMSNVHVNDFQCSKQIDKLEHQYNISLKKNAQQVAKLSLIPRRRYLCAPTTPANPETFKNVQNPIVSQQFKHSKFLPMNSSLANLSPPSKILKNRPYPEQLILPEGQKSNLLYSEFNGRFGMNQFNNNNLQHLSNQQNQLFRICSQNNLGQPSQQELHNRQEESSSPLLRDKKKSQMKAQWKLNASKGFFQKRKVQIDANNILIKSLNNNHLIRNHTTNQEQPQNLFERAKNGMEISLFKKADKQQIGQLCQYPSSEFIQTNIYV